MSSHTLEAIKGEIIGMCPVYQPSVGNVTQLITGDGALHTDRRTIRSVLREFAGLYGIDLEAARRRYGKVINQTNQVPLPLAADLVLVPVRVREPLVPKDGATGYLVLHCIREVRELDRPPFQSEIILANGVSVPCLTRPATVRKNLRDARLVHEHYRRDHHYHQVVCETYEDYNRPATKADIALLARELINLRNTLKIY